MGKGPVLLKCPACGDKLTLFCPVWFVAAAIGVLTGGIFILNFMVLDGIPRGAWLAVTVAEWVFGWEYGKHLFAVWRKLWLWRHPTRCRQNRGHFAPAATHV